jgi:6-phosphogluconate dehydrogenase
MGQNLVLNMSDHGYKVAVFNRTTSRVDDFIQGPASDREILGTHSIKELVDALVKPRRVMLMVKAGAPVDATIAGLLPYLEKGDIIIDGGNSNYQDTIRRTRDLKEKGIHFIGAGVSGGEEGARFGPSIMPGGAEAAWPYIKEIFQSIAAKVDGDVPCCDWVGSDGAGHYTKMVHNGIEYGDMQLIGEAYHLLKELLSLNNQEMHQIFKDWNEGKLDSYLIEITRDILGFQDVNGEYTLDKILDTAGQKGTGKWTAVSALEMGIPLTLIGEAVNARFLSALKEERQEASRLLTGPTPNYTGDKKALIKDIHDALYASKIISYAQGFMLLKAAAEEYNWNLNYGGIALLWRGGCIIRSAFLGEINRAFDQTPDLANLLLDDYFKKEIKETQAGWRRIVALAAESGIPLPAISSALAFYDGYRAGRLPANLLQAQRDYFGAHTYERVDKPRGEFFHTDWTGEGGDVTSSTYTA